MSYGENKPSPCEYCGLPLMAGQIHSCVKKYEVKIDTLSSENAILREALTIIANDDMPWLDDVRRFAMSREVANEALQRAGGKE